MRKVSINFYGENKHLTKEMHLTKEIFVKDGLSTSEVMKECARNLSKEENSLLWDWNYKND